jgi:2-polyprenyl-3-methyl-5-hydroxy-6-metoxy-1,4-benzoquinol methylase
MALIASTCSVSFERKIQNTLMGMPGAAAAANRRRNNCKDRAEWSVLDVGCGDGAIVPYLDAFFASKKASN